MSDLTLILKAVRPGDPKAAEELLPLAATYLSRANWTAAWFPSTVDPEQDLEAWRALATGPGAVTVNVKSLSFPYLHRGPTALALGSELSARGPGANHFGMIARARVKLAAGKWRFRIRGEGGVRVMVDGKAVIEDWAADAPGTEAADDERSMEGEAEIVVEHFVKEGTAEFRFLLEPVAK